MFCEIFFNIWPARNSFKFKVDLDLQIFLTKNKNIVQTLRTNELKVWTVLSTDDILLYTIVSSFVPSAITQPFFELQTPDFAWKFVWTVPTNYEKKNCKKK